MRSSRGNRGSAQVGRAVQDSAAASVLSATIGDMTVRLPGGALSAADAADPANALLAEYARVESSDRVLLLGVGAGVLATWVAARAGSVTLSDVHRAVLDRAMATLALNGVTQARELPIEQLADVAPNSFDVVLVNSAFQSNSRALTALLHAAGNALRVGGRMYVVGAKAQGITAIKTRLGELFGSVNTLGFRKGVHVLVAVRSETWAAATPAVSEQIEVSLCGVSLRVLLHEGVFARGALDDGSRMLIEALDVRASDVALDLGCGSGIIGMVMARLVTDGHVTLVDSDTVAVGLAQKNLQLNGITNAEVRAGDGYAAVPGALFDLIATNPPFHLGRQQTSEIALGFIAGALGALKPGGRLYVVANRFLPYEREMAAVFGEVREIAGDSRYKVLFAIRS